MIPCGAWTALPFRTGHVGPLLGSGVAPGVGWLGGCGCLAAARDAVARREPVGPRVEQARMAKTPTVVP
jgi:hypothetical protein